MVSMKHETDRSGFPIDPQLRRLEVQVATLAGIWRGTFDSKIVREYHVIMGLLYELGWDGVLDFESELPDELMPDEYLKRRQGRGENL